MRPFHPLVVWLLLRAGPIGVVASDFEVLPFRDGERPTGGLSVWNWVEGDGRLSHDDDGRLVLVAESPAKGDNRVGAVADLGSRDAESFVLDVSIDPASDLEGHGSNLLDCGVTIGLDGPGVSPNRFHNRHAGLSLNVRDLHDVADYGIFQNGRDLSLPVPANRGTGNPRALERHDGPYRFRLLVTPEGKGSRVTVYHTQFVTPAWEGVVERRIVAGHVGVYARIGRPCDAPVETTIAALSLRTVAPAVARRRPTDAESVLYALDLDHPGLEKVKAAMERRDIGAATSLFADHLRSRRNVRGPRLPETPLTEKEQRIADLMTEDKLLVYTGGPLFEHRFDDPYDWAADPYDTGGQFAIYNSRMFPWLYMGRAHRATGDAKYARTFVKQLNGWLDQIPLRIVAKPGDRPFFIDGNTLEPPLLFTGNVGRRMELTWWQAYEAFKTAPEFDDASLLRMMKYFQENARLATNPSIFLEWDDSGLHIATGLLQTASMMPEWREAERWEEIAFDRLERTFRAQVHADGTHASLSTGYGWATIDSYRNVFEIQRRNERELPPKFRKAIRGMVMGYMSVLRPDFGNVSLNDGGWGPVDDKVRETKPLFPDDPELEFFASRGVRGRAPKWTSRYLPNAGWYVMRTGFGPREKYLFLDGGPFGASHGKQDSLHLVVALGGKLLLRDGGRGDYTAKPTSVWSSRTLAFNTLTPDWAIQDRTQRYEHEKHVGRNPPRRPWVSNARFDYGCSTYDAGWFSKGERIGGRHTRHVVFLKGGHPPDTGYWVVLDEVRPDGVAERTWRHPWHLSTEDVSIDGGTGAVTTNGAGAGLRILAVDPDDDVHVTSVRGQREPALQGWHVHGSEARPHAVPMHFWTTSGAFVKSWILLPRASENEAFEVESVSAVRHRDGRLSFELKRSDGGRDFVALATGDRAEISGTLGPRNVRGKIAVVRTNDSGRVEAVLEVAGEEGRVRP